MKAGERLTTSSPGAFLALGGGKEVRHCLTSLRPSDSRASRRRPRAALARRAKVTAGSGSAPPLGSTSWSLGQEAQILARHLHNRRICLNSSKIRLFLEIL